MNGARVLVFGHGPEEDADGWDGHTPMFNTLPSFPWLQAQGVDGVELDVRATADDELVVIHDAAVAGRLVRELRRAEMPRWVPNLADALDACAGMTVIVELKNFPEDAGFDPTQRLPHLVVELLAARGWSDDVVLSSFGTETLAVVRRNAPAARTAALLFGREPDASRLPAVADAGHQLVHPYDAMVDNSFVDTAADLGLLVDVWMLEVPAARYRQLSQWNVHGVITGQLTEALAAR